MGRRTQEEGGDLGEMIVGITKKTINWSFGCVGKRMDGVLTKTR